ncbi:head-tail connector protein [Clostridium sp. D2Q-11]|uniref:Head-tail connector protein n=1 Tax=Anaeromonas frigoriresistens TaxID=2683708 RepID=A0A942V0V3_9FIRM|nr:head-tail connector protein [Anaeromonas frigoriresistens]MBS4539821.1 head-tail connector protein [Anaeromonas frigoriresistens]
MILTLEEVKQFLRIESDYTEEDSTIQIMINNAEAFVKNIVEYLDETNNLMMSQAKLLVLVLVADFYENRELSCKPSEKVRYSIQSIITQLQYSYGDTYES